MEKKADIGGRARPGTDSRQPNSQCGNPDELMGRDTAAAKAAFWAGSSVRLHVDALERIAGEILACGAAGAGKIGVH